VQSGRGIRRPDADVAGDSKVLGKFAVLAVDDFFRIQIVIDVGAVSQNPGDQDRQYRERQGGDFVFGWRDKFCHLDLGFDLTFGHMSLCKPKCQNPNVKSNPNFKIKISLVSFSQNCGKDQH